MGSRPLDAGRPTTIHRVDLTYYEVTCDPKLFRDVSAPVPGIPPGVAHLERRDEATSHHDRDLDRRDRKRMLHLRENPPERTTRMSRRSYGTTTLPEERLA